MLTIKVEGLDDAIRKCGRIAKGFDNQRPAFRRISNDFKKVQRKKFSGGAHWAPLSHEYAGWKSLHFPGKPILVATGALKDSLTGGSGYIEKIGDHDLELGTSDPKAEHHEYGTHKMPARPFMKVDRTTTRRWQRIVYDEIREYIARSG